jgi:hypothetical protein
MRKLFANTASCSPISSPPVGHARGAAAGTRRSERDPEQPGLRGIVPAAHPGDARVVVDVDQLEQAEARRRQHADQATVLRAQLELPRPTALGHPHERLPVGEPPRRVLGEVEPRRVALGEENAGHTRAIVDGEQRLLGLAAILDQDGQRRVRPPHRLGEVGVLSPIPRHRRRRSPRDVDDLEPDLGVPSAGARIAERARGPLRVRGILNVQLLDATGVHRLVGDPGTVRRPPVAGLPTHLLLGDELGQTVGDGVAPSGGEAALGP